MFPVFVKTVTGRTTISRMSRTEPLQNFVQNFAIEEGLCHGSIQFELAHDGVMLNEKMTPASYGIEPGDTLSVFWTLRGRKPVIYLFPPADIEASVTLSLVPEWKLSAIYPVVPIKSLVSGLGEQVKWDVQARKNGSMTEKNTGLGVAYLFWESQYVSIYIGF